MIKHHHVLRIVLGLIVLTVLAACKTTYTVSAHYKRSENARPIVSPDTRFILFVAPVSGPSDQLWYRIGGYTWFLEKSPTTLVEEALVDELELMGIRVTNDPSEGQGCIEAQIRWFAPYGHNYLTAAIIISLTLYPKDATEPLWRGKLQGGANRGAPIFMVGGERQSIEEVVSEALTKAIIQLRWKPGFAQAIAILAGSKPKVEQK